jgi:hypothetical protein
MKRISLLAAVAVAGFASAAYANTVSIDFQQHGSDVDLGTISTFTPSGTPVSLTAEGFGPSGPVDLWAKADGAGETGLGLVNDPSGEHEIVPGSFVQLDLSGAHALQPPGATITLILTGSVQSGEIVHIFSSSTSGVLGSTSLGSATGNDMTFPISGVTSGYIDITSDNGNVLLASAVVNYPSVPDGGLTITLLGGALTALGLARRKLMV